MSVEIRMNRQIHRDADGFIVEGTRNCQLEIRVGNFVLTSPWFMKTDDDALLKVEEVKKVIAAADNESIVVKITE